MKLINITKKRVIASNVKLCKTALSRLKGLMFSSLKYNEALILVSEEESISLNSIHTFFVLFPLDVIWLDKNFKVIDFKLNIPQFIPFIKPKKPAKYVVELKHKKLNISLEDVLKLV